MAAKILSAQSLAVQHRPQTLNDLVGQDHITKQVLGMFTKGKMPSSIMLHGPTGLGKTTVARIIARMVNCTGERDTETYAPCGECPNCRMQDHPDVIELNAGDTRGIDDVRALIQQSRNMPSMGNKRIYILDEFQQFTSQASQCMLIPLESPPPGTLWIICSMSPDKILPAIAKRCLSLQVKPVEPAALVKRLYRVAKREGVDFKKVDNGVKVLKTIADFANGGVRASLQLLESVLYAYHADSTLDADTVLTQFLAGGEADQEKAAAETLFAVLTCDLQKLVQFMPNDNVRGVLSKMRWLIDYLINNSVGRAKYIPYSGRSFAAISKGSSGFKLSLAKLLQVQNLLVETEVRLNSFSIDERVVFMSALASFATKKD